MSSNQQNIKEIIAEFLKVSRLSDKLAERKVTDGWEKLMGKTIARHTQEICIRNKKLFLHITSAPLKQELFYAREKIIKMLNEEAGEEVVKEIIFK